MVDWVKEKVRWAVGAYVASFQAKPYRTAFWTLFAAICLFGVIGILTGCASPANQPNPKELPSCDGGSCSV